MDFYCRMNNFFVDSKLFSNIRRGQLCVVRNDADGTGIGPAADTPDVKVRNTRFCRWISAFNDIPYFLNNRMIHFTIKQDSGSVPYKAFGPKRNNGSADNPDNRVKK